MFQNALLRTAVSVLLYYSVGFQSTSGYHVTYNILNIYSCSWVGLAPVNITNCIIPDVIEVSPLQSFHIGLADFSANVKDQEQSHCNSNGTYIFNSHWSPGLTGK